MSLRVACVGAGYFSQFHYDAWHRVDGVLPVASVDLDIEKAKATGLAAYSSLDAMIGELSPDIVDIVTPPSTHLAHIRTCLTAKPKAIICQKPFCLDIGEAREAARLSEASGIPIIVHENFRFQPWYRAIKVALNRGDIGDVLQLTFRLRPGDGQGPDAYLDRQPYFQKMPRFLVHETAVHWIDTFRFLLGPPKRVFADLRTLNPAIVGEDAGFILFDQGNGARAIFDGNRHLDHAAVNTRCTMGEALIEGTEGTLTLAGDGSVQLRKFGNLDASKVWAGASHQGFGGDCVYHLQSHVVAALRGETAFENTVDEYLPVLQIEDAVYRSASSGQWIDIDDKP